MRRILLLCLLASLFAPATTAAQYFGRNKIQYEDFDFRILETEHFDVYHYDRMPDPVVDDIARMAERWYARLGALFRHEFEDRKPLILYADKPDFQQTNTTGGFISQATGGFTESLKDRVVLPLTETMGGTDHVLGHELVHAFQFDIAQGETGSGPTAFNRLPLWFVEGLAEYLSLGRGDPQTAMWMRDAALRDELPTLDDLSRDPRYFPYRFGQAFWAYVAGRYGDDIIAPLYRAAGQRGIDIAIEELLHTTDDSLSQDWIRATEGHFEPLARGRARPSEVGRPLLGGEDDWVLAPVLSPDGRRVVFFSERDLFTIDLYVADAETGEIEGKLATTDRSPHFDAIAFLAAAGSWSPDGRRFAFVTFAEGDNRIAIADADAREVVRTIAAPGIGAVYDVAWSPDGGAIAFSGGAGGVTDLYRVDLASGAVDRLTDDRYAELHPAWSPDSRTLVFATDRGSGADPERLRFGSMGLGFLDLETGEVEISRPFGDAKHIDPFYAPDGASVYFLSDRGGIPDVYRLEPGSGRTFQVTRVATGVSGITELSPVLSVASATGRVAFSVFQEGEYLGRLLEADEAVGDPVTVEAGPALAGVLPPVDPPSPNLVASYLADPATGLAPAPPATAERPYDPDLGLDYVAPPSAGVAVDRFGASIGGSIGFFFSDMLGDHQMGVGVQANGALEDLGGDLIYVNRGNRFNWGGRIGRVTFRSVFGGVSTTVIDGTPTRVVDILTERTIFNRASLLGEYPFSLTRRIEGDVGFTRIGFDREIERGFFVGDQLVDEEEIDLETGDPLNLGTASLALVEDYSFFGFTSPVRGGRSRFVVGGNAGTLSFANVLADWRRYLFARPVTFAFRALHLGRYGGDAESDRLSPLFVGYPTLIRGYEAGSFDPEECAAVGDDPESCPVFDRLVGSRIAVVNAEFRVPLVGTEEYGLLGGGFLPTELALFADGGTAWTSDESPELAFDTETGERVPVFSAGAALRVNFFGSVVMELYHAWPFQRPDEGGRWGFQIAPGW